MGLGIQLKKKRKKKKGKWVSLLGIKKASRETLPNREFFFKTVGWVLDKTSNTVTKTYRQKERTERHIVNTGV